MVPTLRANETFTFMALRAPFQHRPRDGRKVRRAPASTPGHDFHVGAGHGNTSRAPAWPSGRRGLHGQGIDQPRQSTSTRAGRPTMAPPCGGPPGVPKGAAQDPRRHAALSGGRRNSGRTVGAGRLQQRSGLDVGDGQDFVLDRAARHLDRHGVTLGFADQSARDR